MNKSLIFKAYDKENNKMISPKILSEKNIYYDTYHNLFVKSFWNKEKNKINQKIMYEYFPIICSGKEDYNGELIYDGDILKIIYPKNNVRIFYVFYERAIWNVFYISGASGIRRLEKVKPGAVIIGNIHQHKHILTFNLQKKENFNENC